MKYKYLCWIEEHFNIKKEDVLCKSRKDDYCTDDNAICPHKKLNIFNL